MPTYAPKRLGQLVVGTGATTFYTTPADTTTIVKNVVVANTTPGAVGLNLSAVPAGGVASAANRLVPGTLIGAYSVVTFDLSTVLAAGDLLVASAAAAGALVVTVSGVELPGSNGLSAGSVLTPGPAFGLPVALGTAAAEGTSPDLARADHVHAGITTTAPLDGATAAALGAELRAARGDHRHKTVTDATAPLDPAAAAAIGASGLAARADHVHRSNFRVLGIGASLQGSAPANGPFLIQAGTVVTALSAGGEHDLTFPTPFPNGLVAAWVTPGFYGAGWFAQVADGGYTLAKFRWRAVLDNGTVWAGATVRANWWALGW